MAKKPAFIVMVDGKNVEPMATSQDHKRVGENDTGLNTGGMGAYSPAPVVTSEIHDRIMREVIYPTVNGMVGRRQCLYWLPLRGVNDHAEWSAESD